MTQSLVDAGVAVSELKARVELWDVMGASASTAGSGPGTDGGSSSGAEDSAAGRAVVVQSVRGLLAAAESATKGERPDNVGWWGRHWHGVYVETAYKNYHAARVLAVALYDDVAIEAELPAAVATARQNFGADDRRVVAAERLSARQPLASRRAALQQIVRANYDASDDLHQRLRRFRNIVEVAAVGVFLLMALVTVMIALNPGWVPLCFHATASDSASAALTSLKCPTNGEPGARPVAADIVVVVAMGLLGGSLAAAVSIRNLGGTTLTYDVPVALACLKVPAGALTALAGLIAIRGNFVPGFSNLDSSEQILAYALILGYAQQLATGFLDRRVLELQKKI